MEVMRNSRWATNVVRIEARHGLNSPGIESRWGARFSALVRTGQDLAPTQFPVLWVPGHYRRQCGRVVVLTTHPHLAPRLKKEKCYTSYSLSGTSWSVLG